MRRVVDILVREWGNGAAWANTGGDGIPEAGLLMLNSAKADAQLNWRNAWSLEEALAKSVAWYRAAAAGDDMTVVTRQQINDYCAKVSDVA